jgi:hypothetical protein
LYTLKNSIQKIVLTLCLLLTVCYSTHSQNTSTITITSDQLRTTNLIFAEHKKYSELVPLLKQENSNLQIVNETWVRTDSIRQVQLRNQQIVIDKQIQDIEKANRKTKISYAVGGTVIGITIVTTVLCLLRK